MKTPEERSKVTRRFLTIRTQLGVLGGAIADLDLDDDQSHHLLGFIGKIDAEVTLGLRDMERMVADNINPPLQIPSIPESKPMNVSGLTNKDFADG